MTDLRRLILAQFKLGLDSIHGTEHWRRVEKFGLMLAEKTGADKDVISLFAYFHDSQRENEHLDPHHGARAAEFALELFKTGMLKASNKQFEQLVEACRSHSSPVAHSEDVTVQTCWDADRLDLWRVGETPHPRLLHTNAAKDPTMIQKARALWKSGQYNTGDKKEAF
jgi:uncharacterized protein